MSESINQRFETAAIWGRSLVGSDWSSSGTFGVARACHKSHETCGLRTGLLIAVLRTLRVLVSIDQVFLW